MNTPAKFDSILDTIGGSTDLFDAFASGALQPKLAACGVAHDDAREFDPYDFFPKWVRK